MNCFLNRYVNWWWLYNIIISSEVELKALKEEFQHHQDKVDEYYALVQEAAKKYQDDQSEFHCLPSSFISKLIP